MRAYKRINEDFLDKTDVSLDNVSVLDDARAELDAWFSGGSIPSFNPCVLSDAFYPVEDGLLFDIVRKIFNVYGYKCNLNWLDVSKVTHMRNLFRGTNFNGNISRWDVSGVENMYAMFRDSEFMGNISNWNTKSVTDMSYMFAYTNFNGDISHWDVSSVLNMSNMFENSEFNRDISGWNVSNVYDISFMFEDSHFCQDISSWTLIASHTRRLDTFKGCPIPDNYKPTVLPG